MSVTLNTCLVSMWCESLNSTVDAVNNVFVSDIRSFHWVIAGTLRVNLTRPVVSRAGRLFCVDERVCVFVCARTCGWTKKLPEARRRVVPK